MKSAVRIVLNILLFSCIQIQSGAQEVQQDDTLTSKSLDSVIVSTYISNAKIRYLPDIVGINIYAGKKTNIVYPDPSRANLAQNLTRTALAKIPGLTMWDMDGAGLQVNIGSRGADSHRSIE